MLTRTSRILFAVCCNLAVRHSMLAFFKRCVAFLGLFAIYLRSCTSLVISGESSSVASVSVNTSIQTRTGPSTNGTVTWNAPSCVGNHDWMGRGIIESDCRRLVNAFYSTMGSRFDRFYNFVEAESHSIAPRDAERLPRKYVYGACRDFDAAAKHPNSFSTL